MDSGDALHESGHRGERSSRAIPAKKGVVALTEFMAKPFIHSTPCDPDPWRGLLARLQRHYLAEKKTTAFTVSLFISRRPSAIGASHV
jgi:hypothetical protein